MKDVVSNSVYFGVAVSLAAFIIGVQLNKKLKLSILNPLLVSIVIIVTILLVFDIDYESYNNGGKYISYFLTPATVCLAIPLYQQLDLLKKNFKAIMIGILTGVLTSLTSILALSAIFKLSHGMYVTLLPKSITTAIGIAVSEELGGMETITVAAIVLTGIVGSVLGEGICKLFKIKNPISIGLSLGTASHAIGTSRALELGEVHGAMSSLSIAVSGLLTVVLAPAFSNLL
ncbi:MULTISPECIES: LrgB family protein [unclassified Sedimentibacter]|uniref:LrgB family protein n=1 Tax=unclassified Sedimentibacter TaxID=2649220 RepID=UPI0027E2121A|nr:LrgB family protein [Sedimentibacter sp. MB35-C1]WMJ78233.1 LrgB family protein [Sedimentibacter sp. MB35-C1]